MSLPNYQEVFPKCQCCRIRDMSGHSKWSNIHRKKEANDKVRSGIFTKLAQGISMAVLKGGGISDPEMNFALRLAVDKAKAANMPKENIERAIAKVSSKGEENRLVELLVEGFAPGGKAAFLLQVVTDNRNRSVSELRTLIEKAGGRMGEMGSAGYLFEQVGIVRFGRELSESESLELIDLGLLEIESSEGVLYTAPDDLHKVVLRMQEWGIGIEEATLGYRSRSGREMEVEEQFTALLEKIEEHTDVQEIYVAMV